MQRIEDYIEKHGGRLITATRNNSDNTRINWTKITKKQKWEENNYMGILSDKQVTSHTKKKKLGSGLEWETIRKELNLS